MMAEGEPDLAGERWLMIFGTIMMFVAMFGMVALIWRGVAMLYDGRAHPGLALVLIGVVGAGLANTHDAIMLVLRPERRHACLTVVRALLLFGPTSLMMAYL